MWRRLLSHAAILRAVTESLAELDLRSHQGQVRSALDQLRSAAQAAGTASSDVEAVRSARVTWCGELGRLIRHPGISAAERALLTRVSTTAVRAVADDPFAKLFRDVTIRSASVYGACWPPAKLSVGWLPVHPYGGGGAARYSVTAKKLPGRPVVEIQIYPDDFGPAAYASIPALLVHECVCHVPARHEGADSNSSPFAEGFMDWAAKFFFDLWMSTLDSQLAATAGEHAAALDQLVLRPETPEGAARRRGHTAARSLTAWLESVHAVPHEEAKRRVARLAVALNCTSATLARKDSFVTALLSHYSGPLSKSLSAVLVGRNPPPADAVL